MASTFDARLRELSERIGHGKLVGKLTVDQIYALAIHSGFWRSGPLAGVTNRPRHGGETHFVTNALQHNAERYRPTPAHAALEPGGLRDAMVENVEDWARDAAARTPRESGVLAASGHPVVTIGDAVVYDRPPL